MFPRRDEVTSLLLASARRRIKTMLRGRKIDSMDKA